MELWDLISSVAHHGRRRLERELERYSVKPTEIKVLYSISLQEGCRMNTLADLNGITGPWITGIVDELESKGYVTKSRNENDRRIITVSITESGRDILSKGMVYFDNLLDDALKEMNEEQIQEFKDILKIIDRSLN